LDRLAFIETGGSSAVTIRD